ncbi:MAG: hypothetical protein WCH79_17760, partial [Planctomycetia bacterium]
GESGWDSIRQVRNGGNFRAIAFSLIYADQSLMTFPMDSFRKTESFWKGTADGWTRRLEAFSQVA